MDSLIIGAVSCLLEKAAAVTVNKEFVASDFLFLAYLLLTIKIKRAAFIVAFFILEFIGYFTIPVGILIRDLFSIYVIIYAIAYWVVYCANLPLKSLRACAIMVALQIVMTINAIIFQETTTFMYLYYEYFVVLIHLYFISSFIQWEFSWRDMADSFNNLVNIIRYNYNFSFLLL